MAIGGFSIYEILKQVRNDVFPDLLAVCYKKSVRHEFHELYVPQLFGIKLSFG